MYRLLSRNKDSKTLARPWVQYWLNVFWERRNYVHLLALLPWVTVQASFAVHSESASRTQTSEKRREVGTCKILDWAPECSVLLIKGSKEEALAFISPWNWLIISLAEFLSADSLISFHTVLYLFRSMFLLLNFQATYCLYLSHHSFFFPCSYLKWLFVLCHSFLAYEKKISKVWAKNTWLCHFRVKLCITGSLISRAHILGLRLQKLEWVQKRIIRLKKVVKIFSCWRKWKVFCFVTSPSLYFVTLGTLDLEKRGSEIVLLIDKDNIKTNGCQWVRSY